MTSTSIRTRPASRARRYSTIGSSIFVVLGVLHAFGQVRKNPSAAEDRVYDSMAATRSSFSVGIERDLLQANTGFSLMMAFLVLACGVLGLTAVRAAPQLIERRSGFLWCNLGIAAGACAMAAMFFPEPVIAALAISAVCFALALGSAGLGESPEHSAT